MIVTVESAGKWGSFKLTTPEGVKYAKPSSKCTTPIEIGQSYEVNLYQPEGKKTVYITKAKVTDAVVEKKTNEVPIETKKVESSSEPKLSVSSDEMTKEDWAKKDLGIKWLACVKASAVFNAHRPDITIDKVISDAKILYTEDTSVKEEAIETTGDINDPYAGL